IGLNLEPIIGQSKTNLLKLNMLLVLLVLSMTLAIIILYLKNMYREIEDMTNYVYNSSEGKHYNMKKYNQEGQLGFLKTELVKMTSILKENVDLLKKEKVFLNNSISDISHQLKTPMTSLIILNDIMYDDIPQDIKIDFLDKIKSQLNRMDWLIKSMLKLSKVEAKVIDFKKEEINIKELIHKSIEPVKIPMEIKNISLIINGDNQSKFYGDMNWCVEAMLNIIKNCVEHTPEEGTLE
ncbi:MAG: HAMP domain-containing sensor histidine kinase, partial [Bacilli bacterium]